MLRKKFLKYMDRMICIERQQTTSQHNIAMPSKKKMLLRHISSYVYTSYIAIHNAPSDCLFYRLTRCMKYVLFVFCCIMPRLLTCVYLVLYRCKMIIKECNPSFIIQSKLKSFCIFLSYSMITCYKINAFLFLIRSKIRQRMYNCYVIPPKQRIFLKRNIDINV